MPPPWEPSLSVVRSFGAKPCFLSSLRIQPQRCALVAPALNQHIEDLALIIDGAP